MSSTGKLIVGLLAFALIAGLGSSVAKADVTGSFTTTIHYQPQFFDVEVSKLDFDVENALDLSVVISGLSTTIHTHFGLAGVEDVILTYAATLGALDIEGQFVFGRFAGICAPGWSFGRPFTIGSSVGLTGIPGENCAWTIWDIYPDYANLHFVKKRVKTSISLGGVSFSNLAIIEDVNFRQIFPWGFGNPNMAGPFLNPHLNKFLYSPIKGPPDYAFGDVLTLSGTTPSGISITAQTGFCAEQFPNVIKKHWWPFRVNAACAGQGDIWIGNFFEEGSPPVADIFDENQDLDIEEEFIEEGDGDGVVDEGERWIKLITFLEGVSDVTVNSGQTASVEPATADAMVVEDTCRLIENDAVFSGQQCHVTVEFGDDFGDIPEDDPLAIDFGPEEGGGSVAIPIHIFTDTDFEKPDILFDFEKLWIEGVPLAQGVTASAVVVCKKVFACSMTNWFEIAGGPVPFTGLFHFSSLTSLTFDGASLVFSTGAGSLTVGILSNGTIGTINLNVNTTLNPDTNPANFTADIDLTPGLGITDADFGLSVSRSALTFAVNVDFNGTSGNTAVFNTVTFSLQTAAGPVNINSSAVFNTWTLVRADTRLTLNF